MIGKGYAVAKVDPVSMELQEELDKAMQKESATLCAQLQRAVAELTEDLVQGEA